MSYSINKLEIIKFFITGLLSFIGIVSIFFWFKVTPFQELKLKTALENNLIPGNLTLQKINIKGEFMSFSGTPSLMKNSWKSFRGNNYDNINSENIPLSVLFNEKNIPLIWEKDVGEGYAGAAIANGSVYLLDYDKLNESDSLRCFSLKDGKDIWRRSYKINIKRNHGISRTVPAVSDKYAVSIGPKCQVMCVNAINGDFLWGIDLQSEFDTKVPLWYTGQCPLIDGNTAVIAPSGKALMIGVDLETGKILWETPNPNNFEMSHSSIMPMTFFNKKMYIYSAIGGLCAVSAEEEDLGQLIMMTKEWTHAVISPSPLKLNDNKILVTAGYGAGSAIFEVVKNDDKFEFKKLSTINVSTFACEQHTPIFYDNHLFSILPNDAGELNRQLVCMNLEGKIIWSSGKDNRFGLGPFIIADKKIFILDDNGVLTIAKADTSSYKQLNRVKVLNGRESWAPIAIAGSLMIIRDFEKLVCLDLKEKV